MCCNVLFHLVGMGYFCECSGIYEDDLAVYATQNEMFWVGCKLLDF